MLKSHYETLGIPLESTPEQIRSAYRKLVLKHHPDRSTAPDAAQVFMQITEAYGVLIDPDRRKSYDLVMRARIKDSTPKPPNPEHRTPNTQHPAPNPQAKRPTVTEDLTHLTSLFSKGRHAEAEKFAFKILEKNPREAIPYGVLGDIARSRGDHAQALNMYAHAVQADPRNPVYQHLYEELVRAVNPKAPTIQASPAVPPGLTLAFGGGVCAFACIYIALAKEAALFPTLGLISTWSLGLIVMLFLCGVSAGVSLTMSGLLDRFSSVTTTATGRVSPALALGTIAIVSFWAASALYWLISFTQNAFNYSTSRVIGAVAGIVLLASLAAYFSDKTNPLQVLIWGGNLTYIGAICGWMVTDSLKRA